MLGLEVLPAAAQAPPGSFIDAFVTSGSGELKIPRSLVFGPDGNLYVSSFNEVLRYEGTTGAFIDVFVEVGSGGLDFPRSLVFGPDGNLYVSSFNGVLRYEGTTGAFIDVFVEVGSGGLDDPIGLVFGPDGNLYVSSEATDEVLRYEGTTGAFIDAFVETRSGGLSSPRSLVFGPDGNLYVSNQVSDEVLRYEGTTGAFIDAFVETRSGGLNFPEGLVFGPDDHLYLISSGDEALRYDGTTGAFIDVFVEAGSGGLDSPAGLVFGPDGNLYVSNLISYEVLRYEGTTGAFIDAFVETRSGGLDSPTGLVFGPDGNLYVNSHGQFSSRVIRYNGTTGAFIDTFAGLGNGGSPQDLFPQGLVFGPDGNLYVSSGTDVVIRYNGTTGAFIDTFVEVGSGGLDAPQGLVFGPNGHLFVSSRDTDAVLHYDGTTGGFIDAFVEASSGGLDDPIGLVFGPDGNLYVSSEVTDEVLRYEGTTGAFIDAFVEAGSGGLSYPRGLVFGPDGNLYVSSSLTPAVLRYEGTTGAFIDAFVETRSGGLNYPQGLVFGPDGNLYVSGSGGFGATGKVLRYVGPRSPPQPLAIVNVTGDASDANLGDNVCETATPGECSLRAAIEQANARADADVIEFNIPGAGPHTIQPGSTLPEITQPVTIDGYMQPGAMPNTLAEGSDAVLLIELDGSLAGESVDGLRITGANSTIRGLVINRFSGDGIDLAGPGSIGNVIEGNFIGTDMTGRAALGNEDGVVISSGATGNLIGGTTVAARNVISGNDDEGVDIRDSETTGNVVQGNYVGTDVTGTASLGNGRDGVIISRSASTNLVGGTTAAARNVISGNNNRGVRILGEGTTGNRVEGNYIGIDVNGTVAFSNNKGVLIDSGASNNTIGGTTNTTPGGPCTGACNVISGNISGGVEIGDDGSDNNHVEGNFIGTDVSGTLALGNGDDGVVIAEAASGNTVGGTTTAARNLISGNGDDGVAIGGSSTTGNRVQGNYIGTDITGTTSLGNIGNGVVIRDRARGNTIGSTTAGARNLISGNGKDGVSILDGGTTSNVVHGNYIGTDVTGTIDLGNGGDGVSILRAASNNTIGGHETGARNIISGNEDDGIDIRESGTTGNVVRGNFIGTDATGTQHLGNGGDGVSIELAASNNIIGGTIAGASNVISGNLNNGVFISGSSTTGNLVQGNFVGSDVTGNTTLGNNVSGISISDEALGNTIGGTEMEAGNTIAFNGQKGITLLSTAGNGNEIRRNTLFQNAALGIDIGDDGPTDNDAGDGDDGPNRLQNFPDLTDAEIDDSGNLLVTYAVDTDSANAAYPLTIEFFKADTDGQEGQILLGRDIYTTGDYNAFPDFNVCLIGGGTSPCEKTVDLDSAAALDIGVGDLIVATATDAAGNTSEFSFLAFPVTRDRLELTPPAIPSGLSAEADDGQVTLRWMANTEPDLLRYRIYRGTSSPAITLVDSVEAGAETLIDTGLVNRTIYYYRLTAVDTAGNASVFSGEVSALVRPTRIAVEQTLSFPDTTQTNYRMVGIPGDVTISVSSTFPGQVRRTGWRAFWDNGQEDATYPDYLEECVASSPCTFMPGRGFWGLSQTEWTVSSREENAVFLDMDYSFAIPLQSGWNIISNPFDVPVAWNDVKALNRSRNGDEDLQPLWDFKGSSIASSTLEPYRGYYFLNMDGRLPDLEIPFPALNSSASKTGEVALVAIESVLRLSVYGKEGVVSTAEVGIWPEARPGLDSYDYVAPPGAFDAVKLSLVREELPVRYQWLAREVRPELGEGQVFELVLQVAPGEAVTMQVEGLEQFEDSEVYLMDRSLGKTHDLRAQQVLELRPPRALSAYRLLIGSVGFIEGARVESVPEDFRLLPNYPNPFNPSTIIEYALPSSISGEEIWLEVYNVLGQRVRVLVDGREEAGFYRVEWDGTNEAGLPAASGVYLYRLQVGRFSQVRHMLLLK